jgi:hypothetical protein
MHKNYWITTAFAVTEVTIGILGGNTFISSDLSIFSGKELSVSIPLFYSGLIIIFFCSTILPGFINLLILKLQRKFPICALKSIKWGGLFLLLYIFSFSFLSYTLGLRVVPSFLLLLGFVSGFNLSLFKILDKLFKNEKVK